jgi:hypothetical protein
MLLADSQVPPGERHPAEERVGLGVLCVLSGPLPAEIEYLQAIQKVWVWCSRVPMSQVPASQPVCDVMQGLLVQQCRMGSEQFAATQQQVRALLTSRVATPSAHMDAKSKGGCQMAETWQWVDGDVGVCPARAHEVGWGTSTSGQVPGPQSTWGQGGGDAASGLSAERLRM